MAIELDTTKSAAQLAAATTEEATAAKMTTAQKLTALLSGDSVKVTDGSMTDLEALVARLKNDQEKTKYAMLMSSLGTIGDSLTEAQKKSVEEGMALTDKAKALEAQIKDLDKEIATGKGESLELQVKIDALTKQIEAAVAEGKEHNELVQKQKALKAELDAKKAVLEEKKEARTVASAELSKVNAKLSSVVDSIGANVLKTIADEFAQAMRPEEAETNAESEKKDKKAEATSIFLSIRDAIDKFEGVIRDTVEENRTNMV